MSQTPKLEEVIEMAIEARLDHVYTAMPGRVESYDAQLQSVDVQPLVTHEYIAQDGSRVAEKLPVIGGVPVVFPGAGSFALTFPINPGDTGLIIFSNYSLDQWLANGDVVNPASDRRHSLADAIFIPGLRPFAAPIPYDGVDDMSAPNGGDAIVLWGQKIRLGSRNAADPVVRRSDLLLVVEAFNNHKHQPPVLVGASYGVGTVTPVGTTPTSTPNSELDLPDCSPVVSSE